MSEIDVENAIERMLQDSQCLGNEWLKELKDFWNPDPPPVQSYFSTVGRMFALQFDNLSHENKKKICLCFDFLLCHGSESVKDAVATGSIEAISHLSDEGKINRNVLWPYLGKASKDYWIAWDEFNGIKTDYGD